MDFEHKAKKKKEKIRKGKVIKQIEKKKKIITSEVEEKPRLPDSDMFKIYIIK